MFSPLVPGQRANHDDDIAPVQLGFKVRVAPRGNLLQEFLNNLKTKLRVRHLAPSEAQRHLHLHLITQEIDGVHGLHPKVMRINLGAELDLLHLVGVLVLPGFFFALRLFVTEFAVIDQTADRWIGIWCHFDQVHAVLTRQGQGLSQREDPDLFSIDANYADFPGTDLAVYPDEVPATRRVARSQGATQDTLFGW